MYLSIFRLIPVLVLVFGIMAFQSVQAKTPEEECTDAQAAGLQCRVCGDCAVITTRQSEKICKQCNEYQCSLVDCKECSDSDCAQQ